MPRGEPRGGARGKNPRPSVPTRVRCRPAGSDRAARSTHTGLQERTSNGRPGRCTCSKYSALSCLSREKQNPNHKLANAVRSPSPSGRRPGAEGESQPPLPQEEGWGEGVNEPPLPLEVSRRKGESQLPLPQGEGWGEGIQRQPHDHIHQHRPEALELLQRPSGRRPILRRLPRAADLPHLSQDDARAQPASLYPVARLPAAAHTAGPRLAQPPGARRGRAGDPLPPYLGDPCPPARYHRSHLREGPEQDPRAGDADPAHQRADRQRELACPQRRREGRRLRVVTRTQRAGREDRRRPVLHASSPDPGHRRCPAAPAGYDRLRPGLRHWRIPLGGPRLYRPPSSKHESGPARAPQGPRPPWVGDRRQRRPARRHEPVSARHRWRQDQHHRR